MEPPARHWQHTGRMPKHTWIIATILSALVIVGVIGFSAWQKSGEIDKLREELRAAQTAANAARKQTGGLAGELAPRREPRADGATPARARSGGAAAIRARTTDARRARIQGHHHLRTPGQADRQHR